MRRILLLLSAITVLSGCYKDDINDLQKEVDKLKERMAQYENLLEALNSRLYVTSYATVDGNYVITMSDGTKFKVRDSSSFIEIGANGNWWIDGIDSGHSAVGEKGDVPTIVVGSNGNWWINDVDTGVSARGQAGKEGSEIVSIAMVDGVMTFVFADGRTISIEASAPSIEIVVPAGGFTIDKMTWLRIQPTVGSTSGALYRWILDGQEIATTKELQYVFAIAGSYNLEFKAINGIGESSKTVTVRVNEKIYVNKITKVYDFLPAPGQFTNAMPEWVSGDTAESMRQKAETALTSGSMISLGGFGGYVVMGFDHTVVNKEGADFVVLGNAYNNWAEPGVVMVSYDANGNGLPDDEWFEIAGSEYHKPTTVKSYEITYFKPSVEPADPNEPNYIRWSDNKGGAGYIAKNSYHDQSFYPSWMGESYTLKGTKPVSNIFDQSGTGSFWANPAYEFGYADNWSNSDSRAQIDISWAVDKGGNVVALRGIDFVKVYTANHASAGWLGEVSTEVSGFTDLNL